MKNNEIDILTSHLEELVKIKDERLESCKSVINTQNLLIKDLSKTNKKYENSIIKIIILSFIFGMSIMYLIKQ